MKKYIHKQINNREFKNYSLHWEVVIFDKPVPKDLQLQRIADDKDKIKLNKDQVDDANYIKIDILSDEAFTILSQKPIIGILIMIKRFMILCK